jgi:hypothetical protein
VINEEYGLLIGFRFVLADVWVIEPSRGFPVDVTNRIPGCVLSKFGWIDAFTLSLGAMPAECSRYLIAAFTNVYVSWDTRFNAYRQLRPPSKRGSKQAEVIFDRHIRRFERPTAHDRPLNGERRLGRLGIGFDPNRVVRS